MWRAEYKDLALTLDYSFFYSYFLSSCPVLGSVGDTVVTETSPALPSWG